MEWIKAWVMQIAGIIAISAICDIIMPEGNIKKYIKPIFGLILIFTIIKPTHAASEEKLRLDIWWDSMDSQTDLVRETDSRQLRDIATLYEKNLSVKIVELVEARFGLKTYAQVRALDEKEKLGILKSVEIEVVSEDGRVVNCEEIKRYISEELGTDKQCVRVLLRGED